MKTLITFSFLFIFLQAFSANIEVCQQCKIQKIELAYQSCNDGDTITINGGKYSIPPFDINKSITVIGKNGAELISANGKQIITIIKDHVSIIGLTLSGVKTNYLKENAAIRIKSSKYFNINNNTIKDCFFAIYLEKAKDGVIQNNQINGDATTEADSGNGIHAWYCKKLLIKQNNVTNHRDGIYLEFVDSSDVQENLSHNNTRYGLHYMFSNDDNYTKNTFKENGVGVAVMFSSRITMKDNTFSHNWGHAAYGLLLKEISDAEITNNVFEQNTIGIFVEGSNRINYFNNEFSRNGWAIKFSGGSSANVISKNNFLNNSIDLVVSTKLSNNLFDHNYWSEYAGYDLDKDKVGDVPHYPVKLYSYILDQVPESVVLMRSLFVDLINYAEKVSPVFTPKDVKDNFPQMYPNL